MNQTCDRCHKPAVATMMSMFNRQQICMDCIDAEKKRPDYQAARAAESEACRRGEYNFPGVGLGPNDR